LALANRPEDAQETVAGGVFIGSNCSGVRAVAHDKSSWSQLAWTRSFAARVSPTF